MTDLEEDGWILWSRSVPGTTEGLKVYAQVYAENEGDRGEIVQMLVTGRNLTTDKLRSIPLGHIQALANTDPDLRPSIKGEPPRPISKKIDQFTNHANGNTLNKAHRKARQAHEPLTRPDGKDPDAFYKQVAEAYRDVVQTTNKVAKVLAEESDVPVGTVHRWILEARRRGFLPSARQGRVG
jgi:hypothetical protein